MDTKFWGPSGWKLLHSITFKFPSRPTRHAKDMAFELFDSLKYVLPCRFCRESYKQFLGKDPIQYTSREKLSQWLYRIHNYVNNKLRHQGYLQTPNPTFEQVKKEYQSIPFPQQFVGWDFLFSIAMNYPEKPNLSHQKPISSFDKYQHRRFLQSVLYFSKLQCCTGNISPSVFQCRENMIQFLYSIFLTRYGNTFQCLSYDQICSHIRQFQSSSCKKKNSNTCRAPKKKVYSYIDDVFSKHATM